MSDNTAKQTPFFQGNNPKIFAGIIAALLALFIISQGLHSGGGIESVARQQLKAIGGGDVEKAYNMMSKAFQDKNSFEVFNSYVQDNPILSQYSSVTFTTNKIDGGIGYLDGTLEANDGSKSGIQFQLVKESNAWKIQVFQLTQAQSASSGTEGSTDASGSSIHDILISDSADLDGYVQEVKTNIPSSASKIFATAEISVPAAGAKVQAILKMPDGGKLGPVTGDITGVGNVLKAFSFQRAKNAWPTGDYELTVSLSSGAKKSVTFQVQ